MARTGREMIEAARQAVSAMSNADVCAKLTVGENIVVLDIREREEWNALSCL